MIYSIVLSNDFLQDLDDVILYYATVGGERLADEVYDRIDESLRSLEFMPKRCAIYPRLPDMRQLAINKLPYRAYFTVNDTTNEVRVLRILYTSRNHEELLEE